MQAIEVFKHAAIGAGSDLAKAITLRESATGAMAVGILPCSAKGGKASLRSVSGLKGQALKAYKRRIGMELKTAMAREFAGMSSSADWAGRRLSVSKSGVVGFFLEKAGVAGVDNAAIAKTMTDAELLAMIAERGLNSPAPQAAQAPINV